MIVPTKRSTREVEARTRSGRRSTKESRLETQRKPKPLPLTAFNPYWDEPRYILGDAAAASGLTPNLLKSWLFRKHISLGPHDREASGKGSSRFLSLRRVLSIALAAEMVRLGLSPSRAGAIAHAATAFAFDETLEAEGHTEWPTDSLLVIYPADETHSDECETQWSWIPASIDISIRETLRRDGPPFSGSSASVAAVSLKAIVERMKNNLAERGKHCEKI